MKTEIVGHLLAQKSSQNNSIKGELEEQRYVALEGASKISLSEARKIAKNCQEKDAFDIAVHLTMQSRVHLYILYRSEQTELLTFLD